MPIPDCRPNASERSPVVEGDSSRLSTIRPHATHVLDQWRVEIFREPEQSDYLARVVGLPGLLGRGPTEAASVNQLRKMLWGRL